MLFASTTGDRNSFERAWDRIINLFSDLDPTYSLGFFLSLIITIIFGMIVFFRTKSNRKNDDKSNRSRALIWFVGFLSLTVLGYNLATRASLPESQFYALIVLFIGLCIVFSGYDKKTANVGLKRLFTLIALVIVVILFLGALSLIPEGSFLPDGFRGLGNIMSGAGDGVAEITEQGQP